jgi:peptide/nickel transport system substrate-binding protein
MNEVLCFGLCSPQQAVPVHRSVSFAQEEWFTHLIDYDPDRANEILDEIGLDEKDSDGFRLLSNGEPLVIYLAYPLQAGNPARHELTKEYWEDVGVRVELREISSEAYRTMASNNEHDIAMFNSGATVEPILLSSPLRLTPPFGDAALEPLCGGPWLEWYNSDGASGEEPPEDVQQLWPLVDQWKSSMPGSDEYAQLGQQIVEIHRDHMWLIGAVSNPPSVTIVSRSLGNTPEWTINGFEYYRTYPFRPDQWYFTES